MVHTKEEADHSLPYLVAVALLDGQVMPEQFRPDRIRGTDVQELLRRVTVRPDEAFSRRFPSEMHCRVRITLRDGRVVAAEQADYPGFVTRGRTWEAAQAKFADLAAPYSTPALRERIQATVSDLERVPVTALTHLLASAGLPRVTTTTKQATA